MDKSKWLVISHAFNMDGRAASLTVTDKIPYLLKRDISVVVLSAVTGSKDQKVPHYQLLPWGPSGLRFDFRHWVAIKYGRGIAYRFLTASASFILFPFVLLERLVTGLSSQSSWAIPAAIKGINLARKGQVNLIFSSGGAWSAHYAAWVIKKFTGLPWIAEIHDPMVIRDSGKDDGVSPRNDRDARFLQKLEGLICKDANLIWWFTRGALAYAKYRHSSLADKGFVVFPGAEPPGCHEPFPIDHKYGESLNFCHFGSMANDRSLEPFLQALNIFFNKVPLAREQIKIQIYGANLDDTSRRAIKHLNMQSNVICHGRIENDVHTGELGRERIMRLMRSSDILLCLHGGFEWCSEYIPSKLYDYFWTNRPILAITNINPELDQILKARNSYLCHTFNIDSIVNSIAEIWHDWEVKSLRIIPFKPISPESSVDEILRRVEIEGLH